MASLARRYGLWAYSRDRVCFLLVVQTGGGRKHGPCVVHMRVGRTLELADARESAPAVVHLRRMACTPLHGTLHVSRENSGPPKPHVMILGAFEPHNTCVESILLVFKHLMLPYPPLLRAIPYHNVTRSCAGNTRLELTG